MGFQSMLPSLNVHHGSGVMPNDGPALKLLILGGWGRSFFVCYLAPLGSFTLHFQSCCLTSHGSSFATQQVVPVE